jgi:hydroxymethylbilane synthase
VAALGDECELIAITTSGDRDAQPGDKSRFVKEIDEALLRGEIDVAVHSAKDVPGELEEGLMIAAVPVAEDARDCLVGAAGIEDLEPGARVGSSSLRRQSQLLASRDDIEVVPLRGNVDTRLRKVADGDYDAIVLATAGLRRLGRNQEVGTVLERERFVPAAGQGLLALETRADDEPARSVLTSVDDGASHARLLAERAAVTALGATCYTPVGVNASIEGETIELLGYAGTVDGRDWVTDRHVAPVDDPAGAGDQLAQRMLAAGAGEILSRT